MTRVSICSVSNFTLCSVVIVMTVAYEVFRINAPHTVANVLWLQFFHQLYAQISTNTTLIGANIQPIRTILTNVSHCVTTILCIMKVHDQVQLNNTQSIILYASELQAKFLKQNHVL